MQMIMCRTVTVPCTMMTQQAIPDSSLHTSRLACLASQSPNRPQPAWAASPLASHRMLSRRCLLGLQSWLTPGTRQPPTCAQPSDNLPEPCRYGGEFYNKEDRGFYQEEKPQNLSIEDPNDEDNDLGKGSYRFFLCRAAFASAFTLLAAPCPGNQSRLLKIIR